MSRLAKIESIFNKAIAIGSPHDREAFLNEACDDLQIRANVDRLLDAHPKIGSFLSEPANPREYFDPTDVGRRIGPYKIREQLGEGGMGVVYAAQQEKPIRRTVALKIIKPGLDTKEVLARFDAEKQVMAMMTHPNIARAFDAGVTESFRPYFVMELVPGVAITEFCDDEELTTVERLELFTTVCHAVQHAHTKGIVHRDIKPSNILVWRNDGVPVAKIIDFGIAKAMQQPLTNLSLYTRTTQLLGTPTYMSPEQASLKTVDIDTRSDIYSLGVVLYELLTGTTPLHLEESSHGSHDEVRRLIREYTPVKPSARVSTIDGVKLTTIARSRRVAPARLGRLIRGDLDWIVLKAIEKDRNRRYQTATGLAEDVARHLSGQPVTAVAPSMYYLLGKLARQYRSTLVIATSFAVLLLTATVATSLFAIRADREAKTSKKMFHAAEQARRSERAARNLSQQALADLKRNLYVMSVQEADRALRESNPDRARQLIDSCPAELRTWECDFLDYQLQRQTPSIITNGHTDGCNSAVFTADNKYVISAGVLVTRPVKIWSSQTGSWMGNLDTDASSVAIRPGHTHVATASARGDLELWDFVKRERIWKIKAGQSLECLSVSPDGTTIATGSPTGIVKLWNADTHELVRELNDHARPIRGLAFHPTRKLLACSTRFDSDGGCTIWNWEQGTVVATRFRDKRISAVAFSPDGNLFAAGGEDGIVRVLGAESLSETRSFSHGAPIRSVTFAPDNRRLLAADDAGIVSLWDIRLGKTIYSFSGNTSCVWQALLNSDGTQLVSACDDGLLKLHDVMADHLELRGHEGEYWSGAFSPSGHLIATGSFESGLVKIWDAHSGEELRTFVGHNQPVWSVEFSPDGKTLVSGGQDGTIRLWDVDTGKTLRTLTAFDYGDEKRIGDRILVARFNRSGTEIIAATGKQQGPPATHVASLQFWNVTTGELRKRIDDNAYYWSLALSPDGHSVALPAANYTVELRDGSTGERKRVLTGHVRSVLCAAFSPDSSMVASGSSDRSVIIWDATSGKQLQKLIGHTDQVRSVTFSIDGKRLYSSSEDRTVRIWDLETGLELTSIVIHNERVANICFSPTGDRLLTCSRDGTARIWETRRPPHYVESARRTVLAARELVDIEKRQRSFKSADVPDSINENVLTRVRETASRIIQSQFVDRTSDEIKSQSTSSHALPNVDHLPSILENAKPQLYCSNVNVRLIWNRAPNNAFTHLIHWKDQLYVTLREGRDHVSSDGQVRILSSVDGDNWTESGLIKLAGRDLRGASLSVTPDNRLMMLGGIAKRPDPTKNVPTGTFVSFTSDGTSWTEPMEATKPGRWLYQAKWLNNKCFGFTHASTSGTSLDLLASDDGIKWNVHAKNVTAEGMPTECAIDFDQTGNAYGIVRRHDHAPLLLKSSGNLKTWHPSNASSLLVGTLHESISFHRFGGPDLCEVAPGVWVTGGRAHDENGPYVALATVNFETGTMLELVRFRSGGSCGYPGIIWHDNKLHVSYYSSHEGKSSVYYATMNLHVNK